MFASFSSPQRVFYTGNEKVLFTRTSRCKGQIDGKSKNTPRSWRQNWYLMLLLTLNLRIKYEELSHLRVLVGRRRGKKTMTKQNREKDVCELRRRANRRAPGKHVVESSNTKTLSFNPYLVS